MKKYDSYKDSGVEWIGKIPSHWNLIKTYLISENLDGKRVPLNSEERGDVQGEIPYWGSGGIVDYINKHIFDEELLLVGEDGSPFFDSYRDVSFYVNEKIWVNNHIHILRSKRDRVDTQFLVNSFNSVDYKEYITGSTRDKLTQTDLNRIIHPIPPLSEQQKIVSFLDKKTSLIDSLIEKTQRKIELLKEKRTSLINEVVTTGLNPNVEMKDSGVECIGKIPSDWDIPSLNKISNITRLAGYEYTSYWEEDVNGEIEVLRGQNIGFGEIIEKNIDRISNELSMRLIRSRLFKGDLVFPCVGTIGNCVVINEDDRYHINQNISKITPFDRVNSNFLCYYLLSHSTKFQIMFFNTSEVQPSVLVGNLRRFKICLPPIVEQQQIVEYLDEQTQLIDKTISIEEKRIKLLKEYRQSLISEVVTGKRKVV